MAISIRTRCIVLLVLVGCGSSDHEPVASDAPTADAAIAVDAALPDAGADGRVPDELPDLVALCGAEPTRLDDWQRCYQKRRCEWAVNCQAAGYYASVDECVAFPGSVEGGDVDAERRDQAYAVAAGRARIDVDTFARCLAATGADRCATAFREPACKLRFEGAVADGQACLADVECRSPGATCVRECSKACCEGTCRPAYAEGEVCDRFESCEPGLQCNFAQNEPGVFRCVAGDVGTACWDSGDCDPGAWCDTVAQRCEPDLAEGAACSALLQCGGDTECVGLQRRLAPAECRRVSEPGDRCDSTCRGNLYCAVPIDRTKWGTCVALSGPGMRCDLGGPFCSTSHACLGGTCAPRSALGDSCAHMPCLPGLVCTRELPADSRPPEPVCIRPQDAGARCTHPRQCASYRCTGGVDSVGVCLPAPDECGLL